MPIIRVCDMETNGTEPPAEVIETGRCDLIQTPDGWGLMPQPSQLHWGPTRLDPVARSIHHISPLDLAGKEPFDPTALVADAIDAGAIIIAAHAWDLAEGKWLTPEAMGILRPLCTYKAALRVWPDAPSHSNGALRYWLEDQGLIKPQDALTRPAHRAGPDAYVTAWLLKAMLETGVTAREMCSWTKQPALLPRCPIGDYRGKRWSEVPGSFLVWMINKPVEPDLVWNARRELARREVNQRPLEEVI
jgi:exodeoxyribonuclease X